MKRLRSYLLSVLLISSLLSFSSVHAGSGPKTFATSFDTNGIATDSAGHVYVFNANTFFADNQITVYNPNGSVLGNIPIGGFYSGHMEFDSQTGLLWILLNDSSLLFFNTNTNQLLNGFKLCQLQVDLSQVYDVAAGQFGTFQDFTGCQADFSDIDLYRHGDYLDAFVTGLSVIYPFVMRVRFYQNNFQSAKVIVLSRAPNVSSGSIPHNLPRGVAVNSQGKVLTSLPVAGFGEAIYSFAFDFPENTVSPQAIFGGIISDGMTTDSSGNFYLSTYVQGACPPGTGDLIFISADLGSGKCYPTAGGVVNPERDVVISPGDDLAYVTTYNDVLEWDISQPPPSDVSAVAITLDQPEVFADSITTGNVSLNSPAPNGGAVISLSSSDPSVVVVPTSLTIPAGQTQATFQIKIQPLIAMETVTITVSYQDFSKRSGAKGGTPAGIYTFYDPELRLAAFLFAKKVFLFNQEDLDSC